MPQDTQIPDASSAFEDSLPLSSGDIMMRLEQMGIAYTLHTHPPLRTVADSVSLRGKIDGTHIKNLYLRDNKKKNFIVVAEENRTIDLKSLHNDIGCGRLSFGSAERLFEFLGVRPGAVSPLTMINDPECRVRLVIDKAIVAADKINVHPLVNDKTLTIAMDGLRQFLEHTNHWSGRVEI